nr:MAT1-1-1 [Pyricularia grisea]BAC65087.1 MAT1-1-1 [Pyricularia grisea]BAC65091.1 MAT1-1-1 [Pyricularia grisea]
MIASLSPDDIARLIPQETLTSLLRANDEKERLRELPVSPRAVAAASKNKKKVNGFMAFRSYYAGIFQDRPQKERSPFITLLWQKETLKSRWTLMANVFSRIRDFAGTTRGRMAMSGFLRVACPLLGITKPCDYLRRYNWELEFVADASAPYDAAMKYEISQSQIPHIVDEFEVPTTEIELLRACVQGGFPFENSAQLLRDMEDSSVTVMTRTAPIMAPSHASQASHGQHNHHFINTLINDPDAAISALLPQDEDIGSLMVDMNIIHSLETDSSTTSSARNSVSPLEQHLFFHEDVSIDPSTMVSFPGEGHGHPETQYSYPNPTLGLW